MEKEPRRSLWIHDDLWDAAVKAALREGVRLGKPVPVSEWIREAMRQRLEREGEHA